MGSEMCIRDSFTDVDECTRNLHNCAPNKTCVNEYGSFFCKGSPNTLLNNTNVVAVVFAVGNVFIELNCRLSGASHGFIKFSIVLSVLD